MKTTKCKRCDTPDLFWTQNARGKWMLNDQNGQQHHCDDGKLKAVKCKYCDAADLHWAEEVNAYTQEKKAILTESYGLPHACDQRIAFIAKDKQDKKDKYEAEKKRISAIPDGICEPCKGTGNDLSAIRGYGLCQVCGGQGRFSERNKKAMLANIRHQIWPNMKDNFSGRKY